MHSDHTHERRIEVWVRSFAPGAGAKRDRVLDRARRLERRSGATVEIGVWGKSIERVDSGASHPPESPRLQAIRDRIDAFSEWADREGRTVEPYFRTRRIESTILEESYQVLRLPTVAVAEYRDGDLQYLAPSRDATTGDPADPLDELDRLLGDEDADREETRPDPDVPRGPDADDVGRTRPIADPVEEVPTAIDGTASATIADHSPQ